MKSPYHRDGVPLELILPSFLPSAERDLSIMVDRKHDRKPALHTSRWVPSHRRRTMLGCEDWERFRPSFSESNECQTAKLSTNIDVSVKKLSEMRHVDRSVSLRDPELRVAGAALRAAPSTSARSAIPRTGVCQPRKELCDAVECHVRCTHVT